MKVATWNVNSVRARVEHLVKYLGYAAPELLCLQETKVEDGDFPLEDFKALGYSCLVHGQKSYNGVALIHRTPVSEPEFGFPHLEPDHPLNAQKRLISGTIGGVRVHCCYLPNGEEVGSPKYAFKLQFFEELTRWLRLSAERWDKVLVCGDFNVAPDERDLYNPREMEGSILFSGPEREAIAALTAAGFSDVFRHHHPEAGRYSWWDYRGALFWKGQGMRLDHIYASAALLPDCVGCDIDARPRHWKKPSDHTPVWVEIAAR